MLSVDWIQHAVGHGGFHTGQARGSGDALFCWMFDCGSRRTARFDAQLTKWARAHPQPLDWLFISHFDTDHVSGLNTLMSRVVVRDVMVPYVNERELAFLLLYEISRDRLDRWFFELVADPAAFFITRGAAGVTFLGGPRPPSRPEVPDPRGDRPKDDQPWKVRISPEPEPIALPKGTTSTARARPRVQMIEGQACQIDVSRAGAVLRLKPYRAPVKLHDLRGLIQQLQGLVGRHPRLKARPGLGDLAYAIAHWARTAKGRSQLQSIFKPRIGSSNRSSLSLLTVPEIPDDSMGRWNMSWPYHYSYGNGSPAWMNTGDAELLHPSDLSDWHAHYTAELPGVRVMALPHHGSDKNSSAALLGLCPQAIFAAHVKAGGKKHPGTHIAEAAGHRLTCVTEERGTEVTLRFWSPKLFNQHRP